MPRRRSIERSASALSMHTARSHDRCRAAVTAHTRRSISLSASRRGLRGAFDRITRSNGIVLSMTEAAASYGRLVDSGFGARFSARN